MAMTDGVARCLELHAPNHIKQLSLPRLTTRDPAQQWTSGQWMTERSGGSDISGCETKAYPSASSSSSSADKTHTIKGFKWFSSATDSDITLLLAKTPSSDKVSLFWARVKRDDGSLNGVRIVRLKDKFGTKTIPTAELELTGMEGAVLIGREGQGVKAISEVLNITRVHCALGCLTNMRRGFDIATVLFQYPYFFKTLSLLLTWSCFLVWLR
jgi:alkylation response protein AidB-like acyl-CoA dehydrogenase